MVNFLRLLDPKVFNSVGIGERFPETEPYEAGFAEHYNQHLKEKVVLFEEARITALKKARRNFFISLPLFFLIPGILIWLSVVISFDEYPIELVFLGTILSWFGLSVFITRSMKLYQQSIKTDIFPNILSFLGTFSYNPKTKKSAKEHEYSELIPRFHRETSEDHIQGTYQGVDVELFESQLKQRRSSGKKTRYVTVFKGIFITLTMNKNFSGKTVVKKDGGLLGNWRSKIKTLENVKLEDPKFEKMFEVFSDDQIEARYLLTVTFMERLIELAGVFGGKTIECCFYQNQLFMKIPLKQNLFEPGSIFEPEDFIDDSKSLLKELNLIFSIVDILKLNMKINL